MAKEKNLTAVTSVAAADFARVVTSAGASVKATFANVAKYIVETYNGSTVAGSAQSVKSALDSLNSKTTWTKAGTTTGSTPISVPSGWHELNILVGADSQYMPFSVLTTGTFVNGRFPSNGGQISLVVATTSVTLTYFYVGTTDRLSSATVHVWYR